MKKAWSDSEIVSLVLKCRTGDEAAFAELAEAYAPLMNSVIFGMGISPDIAKPDALIALYRAAQSYDLERGVSFGSFARTCITNRLTDLIRSDKSVSSRLFDLDVERIAVGDGTLARLERAEERAAFHAVAKECLSEYEYRILLLWLSLDKTSAIAKELGMSAKSVDNAKSRILKKLRGALGATRNK